MGEVLAGGGGSSRSHWRDDTEVPAYSSCQNWGSISINHSGWGTLPGAKEVMSPRGLVSLGHSPSQAEDCWELLPGNAWVVFLCISAVSPGDHFMFSDCVQWITLLTWQQTRVTLTAKTEPARCGHVFQPVLCSLMCSLETVATVEFGLLVFWRFLHLYSSGILSCIFISFLFFFFFFLSVLIWLWYQGNAILIDEFRNCPSFLIF